MKLLVKCTVYVEVEVDNLTELTRWRIEDNGCPGTGIVGAAFDKNYSASDEASECWACNLRGENEIVEVRS